MNTGNKLWLGFFVLIIVSTIGFVITAFSASDQSIREFSQKVSEILIPIIAGGIATKFTTDAWQITKEKIAIKQGILTNYTESYKKMSILLENFMYAGIEKYVIFSGPEIGKPLEAYTRKDLGIQAYSKSFCDQSEFASQSWSQCGGQETTPPKSYSSSYSPSYSSKSENCDPNYSGACVPVSSRDLDCADIDGPVTVTGSDKHRLDRDGDGIACE